MILVEYTEERTEKWHIWYVLRIDREAIISILPSRATYYNVDRGNKMIPTLDADRVCDG